MKIQLPEYALQLFESKRYKVLLGGRGSSKSYTVGRILLAKGANSPRRVLCAREFQNSIAESVHKLLSDQIDEMKLNNFYKVTSNSITGKNGTEFIFKGVRMNIASIKSMFGITDLWLEEAHTISKESWDVLIPTIREPNSEIWVTFNPENEDDPTYKMFVDKSGEIIKRDDAIILKVNWKDNPWFPDVLKKEKDHLFSVNPDLAMHVWEGHCRTNSDSQIFKNKWEVREFEKQSHFDGPYFGADWGFSQDPTVLVKVYLDRQNREILIRHAKFGYKIEIDYIADMFDRVPESRIYKIRADSARPETISFIRRKGFMIEGAEKWKNSVEEGIEWLRTWNKIVIHPECSECISEFKNYSYKKDRLTGDILPEIIDAYNHSIDGIRYSLQPLITNRTSVFNVL